MKTVNIHKLLFIIIFTQSALSLSEIQLRLNTINSGEHKTLSQAVLEIIKSFKIESTSVLDVIKVTSYKNDAKKIDPFMETFLLDFNGSFKLQLHDTKKEKARKSSRNIVLMIIAKVLPSDEMKSLLLRYNFDTQQKFLIVLLDELSGNLNNDVKLMLDIMWRLLIVNVQVVTNINETNGEVSLQTYFPFTKDFCGQVHPVTWNTFKNGTFLVQNEHFPQKILNLFKCTLNVAIFNAAPYMIVTNNSGVIEAEGVDGKLLMTLSEKLNFSLNFFVVSEDFRWGEVFQNKTTSGALELVSCSSKLIKKDSKVLRLFFLFYFYQLDS